jgi:hypothetical protein
MVYMFGSVDIPLFEILFISTVMVSIGLVLVIVGIIYMLRELKALKGLLKEEETDLQEFEKDIALLDQLENKEGKADIKKYIKAALDKGTKWEQIRPILMDHGWDEDTLEKIYKDLKGGKAS